MVPFWVTVFAWFIIVSWLLFAGVILADIYIGGYRQPMGAMEAVWPITGVWAGPVALWAYYRWGRPQTRKWQQRHGAPPELGLPAMAAIETIPGGAASFVGHLIAVPIVVATGMTIAGEHVWPMIILIAAFAIPLLVAFEYASLTRLAAAAGQRPSSGKRLRVALLIATVAVLAFDLGMGATMLLVAFVLGYPPTTAAFWLVMWGGIILGFLTAYPVVSWLLRRGTPQAVLTPAAGADGTVQPQKGVDVP